MSDPERSGTPGLEVRRHDPDRFLLSLFMPASIRGAAWTLLLFNHELARAIETGHRRAGAARDEGVGRYASLVRLQWWREVALGARPRHEVATPLGALIEAGRLDPARLGAMIDAREAELDGIADVAAWFANLRAGPGNLARLLGALAGAPAAVLDGLTQAGAAYGAGASLRNRDALLALGRTPFPADTADWSVLARGAAAQFVAPVRRVSGPALAPALHAVLARRDLARAAAGRPQRGARGIGDRLAVLAAYCRRRA